MKNFTLKRAFFLALMSVSALGFGQTTLSPGDVAITGFNSDYPDQFSFVLLTDVVATTEVNFTDNGLQTIDYNSTDEGIITWTTDADLSCGTEIIIHEKGSNVYTANIGTANESGLGFNLLDNGDQILVFQGDISSASYIYALNFDGSGWVDGDNAYTTLLPAVLTDGVNALDLGETDNGEYNCSVTNDAGALLSSVSDSSNWNLSNSRVTLGGCQYFCNSDSFAWVNLETPGTGTMTLGNSGLPYYIYGRAYEAGVTPGAGAGAGITAWIGISNIDATTNSDFSTSDWTWVQAEYNVDAGNIDEYWLDIAPHIPASGTYYYVSRFQRNDGPYFYGGYNLGGGGFWDGASNVSGVLSVTNTCTSTVTWNGSWIPASGPDITTAVIIDSNYDSSILTSFNACSLTINVGATLIIGDSDFVEVTNDISIEGILLVRANGSLVQINNAASVTGAGNAEILKLTAPLNNWYEYTYWSSPVTGETIGSALSDSDIDRRFLFNASNYRDSTAETNNNNGAVSGQDDIDDDNDAWQNVSGITIMTPGVGYAATHNSIGFFGSGTSFSYSFNGMPNNGVISVPVLRNDTELFDINWNFMGNPYPSAIDVDLFFEENLYNGLTNPNGRLEGSIYLWSQNTPPQGTNNGNGSVNFSSSDYAVINGVGQIAGGDGITPDRFIPSGQGFFTAYTDTAIPLSGNVEFNNSMRVTGSNTQFFRVNMSQNQANKITINLTSNNGVFNQILIGYVDGATDKFDGMFYDAPRSLSTGSAATVYSIIENHSRKFAIQGKNPNSLSENALIKLGLTNTIDVEGTQFTLSINQLEGEFMNSNTVYLRDNLLNIDHELSASDYSFTSETGEFNERFEIFFASTLDIEDLTNGQNQLVIKDNINSLEFSTSSPNISSLQIYDILGRMLFDVDNHQKDNVINISTRNLSNSVLVVKATLEGNKVITKKLMKR